MATYFVNEAPQHSDEKILRQQEILEKAGYSSKEYYLISENGSEYRESDEQVPIREGEKFEAKPRREKPNGDLIHYEVNGEPQTTKKSPISLEIILTKAGRDAGIDPAEPQSYRLENVATGDRYEKLDELVPVHDGDKFVAIHTGPTPVA